MPHVAGLLILVAMVWLVFGLVFKVMGVVPRHEAIVARVVGAELAGPLTLLIGLGETGLAFWVLSGLRPRACALVQTLAIAGMNALELSLARELLLAPAPMVCINLVLVAAIWYSAIQLAAVKETLRC